MATRQVGGTVGQLHLGVAEGTGMQPYGVGGFAGSSGRLCSPILLVSLFCPPSPLTPPVQGFTPSLVSIWPLARVGFH